MLPFTRDQFFDVFAANNLATWPAAIAAYPLALLAIVMLWYRTPSAKLWVGGSLALMWAWVGIAYHAIYFSQINPAAHVFAAAFLLQSALFIAAAFETRRLTPGPASRACFWIGGSMIVYAMAVYPITGLLAGERYPAMPLFGTAPCPLLIFTFGMLILAGRAPWWLWIIPTVWSVVGGSASILLSVPQDWALPVSAIVAVGLGVAGRQAMCTLRTSRRQAGVRSDWGFRRRRDPTESRTSRAAAENKARSVHSRSA